MTFAYDDTDLSSNRSRVRLLIQDTDPNSPIFQNGEIDAFLTIEGDNVKRAAALAYETIAGRQALVLKVIRTLDLTTNGKATAEGLLLSAKRWREQADTEEANDAGGAFDIAEQVHDDFSYRQHLANEAARSA